MIGLDRLPAITFDRLLGGTQTFTLRSRRSTHCEDDVTCQQEVASVSDPVISAKATANPKMTGIK